MNGSRTMTLTSLRGLSWILDVVRVISHLGENGRFCWLSQNQNQLRHFSSTCKHLRQRSKTLWSCLQDNTITGTSSCLVHLVMKGWYCVPMDSFGLGDGLLWLFVKVDRLEDSPQPRNNVWNERCQNQEAPCWSSQAAYHHLCGFKGRHDLNVVTICLKSSFFAEFYLCFYTGIHIWTKTTSSDLVGGNRNKNFLLRTHKKQIVGRKCKPLNNQISCHRAPCTHPPLRIPISHHRGVIRPHLFIYIDHQHHHKSFAQFLIDARNDHGYDTLLDASSTSHTVKINSFSS